MKEEEPKVAPSREVSREARRLRQVNLQESVREGIEDLKTKTKVLEDIKTFSNV